MSSLSAQPAQQAPDGFSEYIAPAKVNLFLRIIKRRKDQFHELSSLFQAVNLCDKLYIKLLGPEADSDVLESTDPRIPTDSRNLVIKALNLFRKHTKLSHKFHIKLEKHIPHEAGLGGGSADAAAMLYAANELLNYPADMSDIMQWSTEIGSDMIFFFGIGSALCTGRGEIVRPVDMDSHFKEKKIYIIKPHEGLSTPLVYENLWKDDFSGELKSNETFSDSLFVNDLEKPAFRINKSLYYLKEFLCNSNMFVGAAMSGSGSSFYAIEGDTPPEREFWSKLRAKWPRSKVFKCKPISKEHDKWYQSQEGPEVI